VPSVRLFVYGSLKRGGRHHAELRGARFVAEARTAPGYALPELSSTYLALVGPNFTLAGLQKGEEGEGIPGELFELSSADMPALDEFEGDDYERRKVTLSAEHSGGFREALAYFRKAR